MVRPFGLIEMVRTGEIAVAPRPQRHLGRTDVVVWHACHAEQTTRSPPARLEERVARGAERRAARRGSAGRVAAVTVPVDARTRPRAAVLRGPAAGRSVRSASSSRTATASCSPGSARPARARGARRRSASPRWPPRRASWARSAFADDPADDPARPPACGAGLRRRLRVRGRRRLARRSGRRSRPACLVLPEVSLVRQGGEARLTLTRRRSRRMTTPDDGGRAAPRPGRASCATAADAAARPGPGRSARAWRAPRRRRTTSRPWQRAVERIRAGELQKVVLAREVRAHAAARSRPRRRASARSGSCFPPATAAAWARRRPRSSAPAPSCSCAATAQRAQTVALAGTTRRSADPSVDDHLGEQLLHSAKDREEQAIVAAPHRAHARAGEPVGRRGRRAGAREGPERPAPRHADPRPARAIRCPRSSWPGCCCPTPAVGGEPREAALPLIPALEGLDRGWYAGRRRLDRPRRGRRVLRGASLRAAARPGGAPVRGLRHRPRLGSGRGAGRDRGQAAGAAAAPFLNSARPRV